MEKGNAWCHLVIIIFNNNMKTIFAIFLVLLVVFIVFILSWLFPAEKYVAPYNTNIPAVQQPVKPVEEEKTCGKC